MFAGRSGRSMDSCVAVSSFTACLATMKVVINIKAPKHGYKDESTRTISV